MSNHCDVCSMDFQDEYALQGHLAGKKHLNRLRLHEIIEKSIVVTPLPKFISTNRLLDFLAKYGAIKWHQFGPNSLIAEFCDRTSAEILLTKPVWINNVRLNIKKRILHTNLKKPKVTKYKCPIEIEGVISYDNIKHIFEDETTFDNQLANFLNEVQLTDDVIEARYESVCTQLDKIFRPIFPKCKTYRFGSTQTGLGFKECDLDIYMDIGEPISEITTETDSWTMRKIFRKVKKVMYRMNCAFSNIIPLPKARTPIIKFCYIRTNVSCDISFKNSLAMYKNHLIKYYICLDSRLKPLMMLIKYWARHFKISGSSKISNYALVLLVIFYLQQPFINIIPPLMDLQKTCQPQIVNGWQVNFDNNTVLPPITNQSSIPQLLHGFFSFYSTFRFKSQVICPIDGKVHTEAEFKEIETLPQCMDRYKMCVREDENLRININKPLCIQDPIELNHNVINVTYKFSLLDTFVKYCAIGAEICVTSSKNNYNDLLKTLFTTVLKTKSAEGKFKITIIANPCNQYSNTSNSMETDTTNKTKLAKSDWHSTVFNIIKDIFEKVFKVQVVFSTETGSKHQKMEESSDVHAEEQQTIVFHCTGSHCVWRNRKISNIVLDPSLSCLEKEALMSEQMLENCDKNKIINRVHLDFLCTLEKKHPLQVDLTVNNFNCDDHVFQEFMYFAKRKIVEIIKRTLMYIQQFEKCYYYLYEIQAH
ncbi:speckle targeted PIP5K1A-regulated poly(A) polymerase [Xylocopa sonorina]|uniref:speckle targeted PIP5K1A-regulated poly(A) polymerase n=1 Tax=Xylocopa sonorina TaxID=1818115 RepID=UPI00403B0A3A